MKRVILYQLQDGETADFASDELKIYLEKMDALQVEIHQKNRYSPDEAGIYLGFFQDFGINIPTSESPNLEDRISVDIRSLKGIIAGVNARSLLLAVYRFLTQAGCRWIRPGPHGEYIPKKDLSQVAVKLDEKPSYRYRGVCIEGAVSYENMLENVDWAPKVGLSSYFLEFMNPYTFFDRWYRHVNNPFKKPEVLNPATVLKFKAGIEKEIQKRGLIYHAPGHGWTCESLGIPGLGWDPEKIKIPKEVSRYFAQIDGKRALYGNIPLNTNLCYSNSEVRKKVVDFAVKYVHENPQIDILHVWLADDTNNHCECEECKKALPSDFYVKMLNEFDEAFIQHKIDVKIAFIGYEDLLWPPKVERFTHPERFVLLFAPISRSYSQSYDTDLEGVKVREYKRNQLRLPGTIRENLGYLKRWQKIFHGDSFTYEYYFMWDCYFDPGYYEAAKIMHADIQKLKKIGLNGVVSDQTQRSFFPTGFGMYVYTRTLWDDQVEFGELAHDYFRSAFGEDGEACRKYMEKISQLFDPVYIRGDRAPREDIDHVWALTGVEMKSGEETIMNEVEKAAAEKLRQVPAVVEAFLPTIRKNRKITNPCQAKSWEYLLYHAEICRKLAAAFLARAEGKPVEARARWEETAAYVQKHEDDFQPDLDVFEFVATLNNKFKLPASN